MCCLLLFKGEYLHTYHLNSGLSAACRRMTLSTAACTVKYPRSWCKENRDCQQRSLTETHSRLCSI